MTSSLRNQGADPTGDDRLLVNARPAEWSAFLNTQAFTFKHALADHPLFTLERLAQLAELVSRERGEDRVLYGKALTTPHTAAAWDGLARAPSPSDIVRTCAEAGTWVALHDTEVDSEYRALLHQIVADLSVGFGRDLLAEAVHVTGHIFVGSPRSVTNYHMDSETNFLCLVRGSKEFHLFDGTDREILDERDIERFYWGDFTAARLSAAQPAKEQLFQLAPGDGLHVPVNFPHWVQNSADVCIALSILLYLPENVERAHAYQTNRLLRLLGITPGPIGVDRARDRRRGWVWRALSDKPPRNKHDVLWSGITRLKAPARAARNYLQGVQRSLRPHLVSKR